MPPLKKAPSSSLPKVQLSEEKKAQLDSELTWCIEHLQLGLKRKDADEYQIRETNKVISTLQSKSVPDVQKRQLMKVVFGDYRRLMRMEKQQLEEAERKEASKMKKKQGAASSSDDNVENETSITPAQQETQSMMTSNALENNYQ
ncbi:hypothetical protein C9374_013696 [Naegleria lovaniensis]|uniref:Uncharacterized protein n=1 Tax=Naegleria lovaniensis TaxID=51637 RepID=A0AA88G601_NAELO|nr:uncharacterized protein C9374_013696 [Naegleria lovaniensis]KAG2372632.1 hypothetical protein C9374_013696 [Naegleria lovaniensis]